MTRTLSAAVVLLATVTAAHAQQAPAAAPQAQFSGQCKDYRAQGQAACDATQWCHWVVPSKAVTLPTGTSYLPPAYCAFKPHHKAAYAAQKK